MVLGGKLNREIVALVQQAGGRAMGLTGSDGGMLRVEAAAAEPDLGRVGRVVHVDPAAICAATDAGFVPVIAPIGVDDARRHAQRECRRRRGRDRGGALARRS